MHAGKDLPTCLDHALPNTSQRWEDWHCWMAFWGQSPSTEGVAAAWAESIAASKAVFVDLVRAAQARGEFSMDEDPAEVATEMQIVVNGIATLVSQEPKDWPSARQREMLRKQLKRLGYRPTSGNA